jgi:hypothetical protein
MEHAYLLVWFMLSATYRFQTEKVIAPQPRSRHRIRHLRYRPVDGFCGTGKRRHVLRAMPQAKTWITEGKNIQLPSLYEQRTQRSMEKNMAELGTQRAER